MRALARLIFLFCIFHFLSQNFSFDSPSLLVLTKESIKRVWVETKEPVP